MHVAWMLKGRPDDGEAERRRRRRKREKKRYAKRNGRNRRRRSGIAAEREGRWRMTPWLCPVRSLLNPRKEQKPYPLGFRIFPRIPL